MWFQSLPETDSDWLGYRMRAGDLDGDAAATS